MISMARYRDDGVELSCPVLLCDACGKPFTNPGMALAVWGSPRNERPGNGNPTDGVFLVHKRECDWRLGRRDSSMELKLFLKALANNTLDPPKGMRYPEAPKARA